MEKEKYVPSEEDVLLTFLKKTSDGEYATIERTSIPYARIEAQTEVQVAFEEEYYYSFG